MQNISQITIFGANVKRGSDVVMCFMTVGYNVHEQVGPAPAHTQQQVGPARHTQQQQHSSNTAHHPKANQGQGAALRYRETHTALNRSFQTITPASLMRNTVEGLMLDTPDTVWNAALTLRPGSWARGKPTCNVGTFTVDAETTTECRHRRSHSTKEKLCQRAPPSLRT